MEQHKLRYLGSLLERGSKPNALICVITIMQFEDRARKCYAEDIHLDDDEFVQMLVLDGCFIIEFFLKFQSDEFRDDAILRIFRKSLLLFPIFLGLHITYSVLHLQVY
ncbi:Hypothetical predicted protein [Olea europaea subsp. europaea]|uniref:Uncharacterized protein n=1 Tax=Olea europaea subsp. europaea TaxID=158383 RepID=A0A8S0TZ43_OLEEU|nr:Hypothetical predicted protein [Olea europaea subsp. europaea]